MSHGFRAVIPAGVGSRSVCATAVNQGPGSARPLGCRTVTVVGGNPFGNFEASIRTTSGVRLVGWVLDPDTAAPVTIHVYSNGGWVTAAVADASRPDVATAYPGSPVQRGFDFTVDLPPGESVCVYAINVGSGTTNPLLQCRPS